MEATALCATCTADGRFVHKDGTPHIESQRHARGVRLSARNAQRRVA
jgi:hypothetical protein